MIRLRPYKSSDSNYVINWIADERCHFKWCTNHMVYPLTTEVMDAYEAAFADGKDGLILTAVNEDDIPVGHLTIKKNKKGSDCVHLSYILVDSNQRKQGIGTELVSLAVKYAFDTMNMKKVTLCVFANNQIARNCYKSAGFKDVAFHDHCVPYKDEIWSYYEMAVEN
ncbi:MAG: GNAT family protein [bacterium]|nr:GNAT family protein [bacterium]